jgi:mono/diheme cytochrome c family protein
MRRAPVLPLVLALPWSPVACSSNPDDDSTGSQTTTGGTTTATPTTGAPGTGADTTGADTTGGTGTAGASSTGDGALPGPWDEGWPIPDNPQVPGDPVAGHDALLTKGYVSCGVPYAFWGLAKGSLGDFTRGDPLPGRTGKNAEVPYNWTVHTPASGEEIVSLNCLECHAGNFNNQLVLGLGVADMDFTSVPMGALVENLPIPDIFPGALGELAKFAGRYKAVGPAIKMLTVGTNPADMLAVQLAAHRDPVTLEWSDEPMIDVPSIMAPIDTPPWWRAHKKNGLFYNGMVRADHRGTMMFASSLCTDSVAEATEILTYFNDINAYIESLRPPPWPFAVDAALAEQGAAVFAASCAGCHGTYSADEADETYPSLLFPLHVIGTDPVLADAGAEGGSLMVMVDWFNSSFYGQLLQLVTHDPFPGYVAPPLDGVWATAPYLHNGSVPTLDALLNSKARPTYWKRVDLDSGHYDQATLGWPYVVPGYGQDGAPDDERKYIYDTTKPGHANTGHVFGDHLSDNERAAVLEYIKTI